MLLLAFALFLAQPQSTVGCGAGANCSSGQTGGTSIGTLNIGRPAFIMTDAVMAQIARQLGQPRELMVQWVGSNRSKAAAERLEVYLANKGFRVSDGGGVMMLIPQLEQPVELRPDGLYIDASK